MVKSPARKNETYLQKIQIFIELLQEEQNILCIKKGFCIVCSCCLTKHSLYKEGLLRSLLMLSNKKTEDLDE